MTLEANSDYISLTPYVEAKAAAIRKIEPAVARALKGFQEKINEWDGVTAIEYFSAEDTKRIISEEELWRKLSDKCSEAGWRLSVAWPPQWDDREDPWLVIKPIK